MCVLRMSFSVSGFIHTFVFPFSSFRFWFNIRFFFFFAAGAAEARKLLFARGALGRSDSNSPATLGGGDEEDQGDREGMGEEDEEEDGGGAGEGDGLQMTEIRPRSSSPSLHSPL